MRPARDPKHQTSATTTRHCTEITGTSLHVAKLLLPSCSCCCPLRRAGSGSGIGMSGMLRTGSTSQVLTQKKVEEGEHGSAAQRGFRQGSRCAWMVVASDRILACPVLEVIHTLSVQQSSYAALLRVSEMPAVHLQVSCCCRSLRDAGFGGSLVADSLCRARTAPIAGPLTRLIWPDCGWLRQL